MTVKIGLMSDVHLEFGPLDVENNEGVDVLILAGDIAVAGYYGRPNSAHHDKAEEFFRQCSEKFPNVLYVMGNHEHYNGEFGKTIDHMKTELAKYPNIHVLENESWTFEDGTMFFGATFWTNMNNGNPNTIYTCGQYMNDYYKVKIHDKAHDVYRRLKPEDTVDAHHKSVTKLREFLHECDYEDRVVVISHHAPSKISTKPGYEDQHEINGAYSSDLSELILDNPNIKLWVHGHTHTEFDYTVGNTRIVTNPRGYVGYERESQKVDPYTFMLLEV